MRTVAHALVAAALLSALASANDFVNTKVVRSVDATQNVVKVLTSFTAKCSAPGPCRSYLIALPKPDASRLALMSARVQEGDEAVLAAYSGPSK
jgi:hypothetical protein